MTTTLLTFEEFKSKYYDISRAMQHADQFKEFHGLALGDEIEKIIHQEYLLYLERMESLE